MKTKHDGQNRIYVYVYLVITKEILVPHYRICLVVKLLKNFLIFYRSRNSILAGTIKHILTKTQAVWQ